MWSEKNLLRCLYFVTATSIFKNYVIVVIAKQYVTQCNHYTNLSERFRNVGTESGRLRACDNTLVHKAWYRFSGDAGNRMPSDYVKRGKCATESPGWVRGNHPRGPNITITAEVCFDIYKNRSCGTQKIILITNCGGYFVYRLPRIEVCYKVYCGTYGNNPSTSPPTSSQSTFSYASSTVAKLCPKEEREGITWPVTMAGDSSVQPCSTGQGSVERSCTDSGWKDVSITSCKLSTIKELSEKVGRLFDPNVNYAERRKEAENTISQLSDITDLDYANKQPGGKRLNESDLVYSVKVLRNIIKLNISNSSLNIIQPASNILDPRNKRTWDSVKTSLEVLKDLVLSLEDYGFQLGRNLTSNKADSIVVKKSSNIELHVKVVKPRSYSLSHYTLFQFPNSSFNLTPNAFAASENATAVAVVVYYRTLHSILTQEKLRLRQTNLTTKKTGHMINGRIITASVRPNPPKEFETPVRIRWKNKYSHEDSVCVYWKPELNETTWDTEGCRMIERRDNYDHLTCECNHLTAFAVMDISEELATSFERQSLEIISTVGCSLSLLGVILTIVSYSLFWTKLHSSQKTEVPSRVLMHLCVVIGMTDILAIIAGPAHGNKIFCTAVSVLLYFFVLSVFGWMLCEGIVIYLQLVRIFSGLGGKHLRLFYTIGWGIPAIVVALSVSLLDRKGFITEHACWFRARGPLLWTFIGLAGVTLLVNIVVFILALRKMFSSHNISRSRTLDKAKAGAKATAVLLPLLGLTWSFGLIVFNRDLIVFKYLFAIFNSLQGLMIFFFHVLLNKQIHDAIYKKKDLRKARASIATNVLPSKNKCLTLSASPNISCTNFGSVQRSETGSSPRTPKISSIHLKRTKYSTPMVFSNITNNDESKENANRKSSRNKSFDELTLEEL